MASRRRSRMMLLVRAMSLGGREGHSNCETSAAGIGRGKESKRARHQRVARDSGASPLGHRGQEDQARRARRRVHRVVVPRPPASPPWSLVDVHRHEDTASTRNAVHRVEDRLRGAVMEQPPTHSSAWRDTRQGRRPRRNPQNAARAPFRRCSRRRHLDRRSLRARARAVGRPSTTGPTRPPRQRRSRRVPSRCSAAAKRDAYQAAAVTRRSGAPTATITDRRPAPNRRPRFEPVTVPAARHDDRLLRPG